jgi:hypothetical protein
MQDDAVATAVALHAIDLELGGGAIAIRGRLRGPSDDDDVRLPVRCSRADHIYGNGKLQGAPAFRKIALCWRKVALAGTPRHQAHRGESSSSLVDIGRLMRISNDILPLLMALVLLPCLNFNKNDYVSF